MGPSHCRIFRFCVWKGCIVIVYQFVHLSQDKEVFFFSNGTVHSAMYVYGGINYSLKVVCFSWLITLSQHHHYASLSRKLLVWYMLTSVSRKTVRHSAYHCFTTKDIAYSRHYCFGLYVMSWLLLTHWAQVRYICVGNLTTVGSDNGLSPGRRQAIFWTNVVILLIGTLGRNFSEISIQIHTLSLKNNAYENIVFKMAAILSRPQCVKLVVRIRCHCLGLGHEVMIHISWYTFHMSFGIRCNTMITCIRCVEYIWTRVCVFV